MYERRGTLFKSRIAITWPVFVSSALTLLFFPVLTLASCSGGVRDRSVDSPLQLIPRNADSFTFVDLEEVRDERLDELEDQIAKLVDSDGLYEWGIDLEDVDTLLISDQDNLDALTVLQGTFSTEDVADELDDADYRDDVYRDIEVWVERRGNTAVALVAEDTVVVGEEDRVEESIDVFVDGTGSMDRDDEVAGLVDSLGDVLSYSVEETCAYRGCRRSANSVRVESGELVAVFAFVFRDEETASDAERNIEDDLEEMEFKPATDLDGTLVIVTTPVEEEEFRLEQLRALELRGSKRSGFTDAPATTPPNGNAVRTPSGQTEKPPESTLALRSVGAGGFHTCGVKTDYSLVCWGFNEDTFDRYIGQAEPPPGEFLSVSAGLLHNCGVKTDNSVACWGGNRERQSSPPEGSFSSVSAGIYHTCGLKEDGSVACWGTDTYRESASPKGSFSSVSAGGTNTCGVKTDGRVVCWGNNEYRQSTPPRGSFTFLSAGLSQVCGVKRDGSLACWGTHGGGTPPEGKFTSVSVGFTHSCGVKTNGSIVCWGSNEDGEAEPPEGKFRSVSVGPQHSCGIRTDSLVVCWGGDGHGRATPPSGAADVRPQESNQVLETVSSGGFHTCGVESSGSLVCWGSDEFGQATPPDDEFISVSSGRHHTCGVKWDSSVGCWGDDEFGQTTSPHGKFTSVSAGDYHTCGVKEDRTVACWGWNGAGRASPPDGEFVSVNAGWGHTCGVKTNGTFACWGAYEYVPTVETGDGVAVSVGEDVTCAVIGDGTVFCLENGEDFGRAATPEGEFISVSAGWGHVCGVKGDGSIACWGNDTDGEATPPAGEFISISAGGAHTCGVKRDGAVACWGRDTYGQATPTKGMLASATVANPRAKSTSAQTPAGAAPLARRSPSGERASSTTNATAQSGAYMDLLGLIPDRPETRNGRIVYINDYDMIRRVFAIQLSGPDDEDFAQLHSEYYSGERETLPFLTSDTIFGPFYSDRSVRNDKVNLNRHYLAFDYANMDESIIDTTPGNRIEVIKGQFDPHLTQDALMACSECTSPDLETYKGFRYYGWGEDHAYDLEMRFEPPAFDELGWASRIAVLDTYVLRTLGSPDMKATIDAGMGEGPSLANLEDFRTLVDSMAQLGVFSMLLSDYVEPWDVSGYLGPEPRMRPFKAFATGIGQDDQGGYMALALVHASAVSAKTNVRLLHRTIRAAPVLNTHLDITWSELIDRDGLEIHVDDRVVLCKIRGDAITREWDAWVHRMENLIRHSK